MATKVLEALLGVTLMGNGQVEFSYGSLKVPYSCSLTDPQIMRKTVTIPAGESAALWDYDVDPRAFSLVAIVSDVAIDVALKGDSQTSSTDPTPSGTNVCWPINMPVDCTLPVVLNSDDVLVNATPADVASDTGGDPTIWGDAGTSRGRCYAIKARNPSSTDDATVQIVLIG